MTDNKELVRRGDISPSKSPREVRTFLDLVRATKDHPEIAMLLKEGYAGQVAEAKRVKNAPVWHDSPVSRPGHTLEAKWREKK